MAEGEGIAVRPGLCAATPIIMKTPRAFAGFMLLVTAALTAPAAFESAKLPSETLLPQYPPDLAFNGVTHGRAVIAVSIDATGRVKDILPLAYTNIRFAREGMEALSAWQFTPARVDGQPVPVQIEIDFDYTLQGAVITTNITDHYLSDHWEMLGDHALVYRPAAPARLDRQPVRIGGEAPKYATGAEKNGVRGRVQVHFYIDETGAVHLPAVTTTAADPYLMEQAVAAVRSWKFEPLTSRGAPVLVVAQQEFNFGRDR